MGSVGGTSLRDQGPVPCGQFYDLLIAIQKMDWGGLGWSGGFWQGKGADHVTLKHLNFYMSDNL